MSRAKCPKCGFSVRLRVDGTLGPHAYPRCSFVDTVVDYKAFLRHERKKAKRALREGE